MAPAGGFSVTPGHYNAQYDYDFRQRRERVSYAEVRIMSGKSYTKSSERGRGISNYFSLGFNQFQVEANRRRIKRWLNDPNASFTQPS